MFVCERESANVWGEKQGVWVGIAVSRETGICLRMIYPVRCVCLGDSANHSRVFDLETNAHTWVTRLARRDICFACATS